MLHTTKGAKGWCPFIVFRLTCPPPFISDTLLHLARTLTVSTEQLGYWQGEDTEHVVLLSAIEDSSGKVFAVVNDPTFNVPITLLMDELLLAWPDRDNYFAVIRRK